MALGDAIVGYIWILERGPSVLYGFSRLLLNSAVWMMVHELNHYHDNGMHEVAVWKRWSLSLP